MALFSVVVPIYKVEEYLEECIKSILAQTCQDFELILVDDGSPDKCPDICDEYSKLDNRIVVIHKENGGLVSARKAGLSVAKGEYIVTVDGDDFILSSLLHELYDIIHFHRPDVIAYGYTRISETGQEKKLNACATGTYVGDALLELRKNLLYNRSIKGHNLGSVFHSICMKCVRKEVLAEFQTKVDDRIQNGEDTAVTLPLLQNCKSLYVLDNCDYQYRFRNGSITNNFKKDMLWRYDILLTHLFEVLHGIPRENIEAYGCRLIDGQVVSAARYFNTYREFITYLRTELTDLEKKIIRDCKPWTMRFIDKLRLYLMKSGQVWLIWLGYHNRMK